MVMNQGLRPMPALTHRSAMLVQQWRHLVRVPRVALAGFGRQSGGGIRLLLSTVGHLIDFVGCGGQMVMMQ
jgi:hypothetical protein